MGHGLVRDSGLLTANHLIEIQSELERNNAGFRRLPGTALKDGSGNTVYTPPQDPAQIVALMRDLERFINEPEIFPVDPLIKMALIHHQFESIHPFYDGNGRTGRIMNVLYLVREGLLDIPVMYLSSYIVRNKAVLFDYKHRIRSQFKFYSQDLINNLFTHPYTKIDFVSRDLQVSRLTATKYLEELVAGGFLQKKKIGRGNYYINLALNNILQA